MKHGGTSWHNRRSIPLKSIITTLPLITMLLRTIIIKPSTITHAASMMTLSITRVRLKSIANKLINIRRQRTLILTNRAPDYTST
jgi:hypothetical protein